MVLDSELRTASNMFVLLTNKNGRTSCNLKMLLFSPYLIFKWLDSLFCWISFNGGLGGKRVAISEHQCHSNTYCHSTSFCFHCFVILRQTCLSKVSLTRTIRVKVGALPAAHCVAASLICFQWSYTWRAVLMNTVCRSVHIHNTLVAGIAANAALLTYT